ncbi:MULTISPECIES: preprotein translocase subunit SecE [Denitromonas]|uniref:Protein translocase subunit SecE n=2 Tax=Denitromonas TaxID=139331 RepID=A0A558CB10_9RHOO|nr:MULTISPECIES: preprotein translocase subunit SecE [Denitromonas]TVO50791.1 preprotein translocase subunit SecE [Denitromonas halophila]TVO57985.1 preprotein translocase subunit SecE [Denitromonas ohlonensis]TVO71856.1 preprotein translocase subunit SecE [Denitromonas ohlonensis]TVT45964.1 MAG: preprotein translocase subunit SecE [Denitromonas halophila]TVT67985.1 MAG: preprotein translocase subunit SecE [Denitromonas halophila]
MADKLKFVLALLLVAAGVAGFYLLSEQVLVLRVLAVLAGVMAGAATAWFTEPGQRFAVFVRETVTEAKKVVWPSRKETVQMTGVVFAFVVAMALFLWLTDKSLEWVLYDLVLNWK